MHPLDSFDVVVFYGHENRLAFLVQSHIVVVSAHHGAERRKQCAQRTAHQIIVLVGRNRDLVRRIAVAVSILCGKGFQHCGQLVECLRNLQVQVIQPLLIDVHHVAAHFRSKRQLLHQTVDLAVTIPGAGQQFRLFLED